MMNFVPLASKQWLVVCEQHFAYLKNIVLSALNEILHYNFEAELLLHDKNAKTFNNIEDLRSELLSDEGDDI